MFEQPRRNKAGGVQLHVSQVNYRLYFQFAILSAAGGFVLGTGQDADGIALIAVVSSLIGFVFVDWLRLFALPPVGAYLTMGIAAAYCVRSFWVSHLNGESQMVAVALLLVLVQAVLMLQRKSRRILEQLVVFCLLELVVAAIFSDALSFGLSILPIALVGGHALSLLSVTSRFSDLEGTATDTSEKVKTQSPDSIKSLFVGAKSWPAFAIISLTPAVLLISIAFFYGLPRKVEASRSSNGGKALVGFDDEVRLQQLGKVLKNPARALAVKLTDEETSEPYRVNGSLYLRGTVLENYEANLLQERPDSKWTASRSELFSHLDPLPMAFEPKRLSDSKLFDKVRVSVTCEPMNRNTLFSIPPYHASGRVPNVAHMHGRWGLMRSRNHLKYSRIHYEFGTHAFFAGEQTPWLARSDRATRSGVPLFSEEDFRERLMLEQREREYDAELLDFSHSQNPTAARLADFVAKGIPQPARTRYRIAKELEQFLLNDPRFHYTLDLNAEPMAGVDPIEQFLLKDHRGHCQYFASALAMMLRSVRIPCRVVIGYRTDEYNKLGDYYVARQQHAHAWVEALLPAEDVPENIIIVGQERSKQYWLRLDPTPGARSLDESEGGSVGQIFWLANDLWEDYVVEMDAERQSGGIAAATGLNEMQSSFESMLEGVEQLVTELRAGNTEGASSSRSFDEVLTWLVLPVGLFGLVIYLLRNRNVLRFRSRSRPGEGVLALEPEIAFYAEALRQLNRVGIARKLDETPNELRCRVEDALPMFADLTRRYVGARYGNEQERDSETIQRLLAELKRAVDTVLNENRSLSS